MSTPTTRDATRTSPDLLAQCQHNRAELLAEVQRLTADREKLRAACESVLRGLELVPVAGMETDAAMLRAALGGEP